MCVRGADRQGDGEPCCERMPTGNAQVATPCLKTPAEHPPLFPPQVIPLPMSSRGGRYPKPAHRASPARTHARTHSSCNPLSGSRRRFLQKKGTLASGTKKGRTEIERMKAAAAGSTAASSSAAAASTPARCRSNMAGRSNLAPFVGVQSGCQSIAPSDACTDSSAGPALRSLSLCVRPCKNTGTRPSFDKLTLQPRQALSGHRHLCKRRPPPYV